MQRSRLFVVLFAAAGCATTHADSTTLRHAQKNDARPVVASLTPAPNAPRAPNEPRANGAADQVEAIPENARASDYLAMGLNFYSLNQKQEAVRAFTLALGTGDLNNQGRALAYWHLFLSNKDDSLQGAAAEALTSFVTVSQLLMNHDATAFDDERLDHVREFIERFELEERLFFAEVTLEAIWALRDVAYGRTPEHPVSVGGASAQRLFLRLYKPCDAANDKPQVKFLPGARKVHGVLIDEAVVSCPGASAPVSFFFAAK